VSNSPQTVLIVRHGSRIDFIDPDWIKKSARPFDPPLSAEGMIQAQELALRLSSEKIFHLFSSPFLRTIATASVIATSLRLSVKIEPGACEFLEQTWFPTRPTWLTSQELSSHFKTIDLNYQPFYQPRYPESLNDLALRTARTIRHLTERYPENILIVGHGASVIGLARALVPEAGDLAIGFCALVKIIKKNKSWEIELRGDTSFLSGGGKELFRL